MRSLVPVIGSTAIGLIVRRTGGRWMVHMKRSPKPAVRVARTTRMTVSRSITTAAHARCRKSSHVRSAQDWGLSKVDVENRVRCRSKAGPDHGSPGRSPSDQASGRVSRLSYARHDRFSIFSVARCVGRVMNALTCQYSVEVHLLRRHNDRSSNRN